MNRPKDDPQPGGRVYDWVLGDWRYVVAIESAGVALDRLAHEQIWPRGSAAALCAMYGGPALDRTKEK